MDYKEKYEMALEIAKGIYKDTWNSYILKIFPELQESEDERIRKAIKYCIKQGFIGCGKIENVTPDECLAWLEKQAGKDKLIQELGKYKVKYTQEILRQQLEKQGEQKPIIDGILTATNFDKMFQNCNVHKFNVGDWCIDNEDGVIFQIVKVLDNTYTYKTNEGKEYSCTHYSLENDAKLWTIADAKDGDVLATENFIFIFKNIDNGNGVHYYCQYEISKHEALPQSLMGRVGNSIIHYSPATKEQRDLLFQKMREAGYEWDAKKKEPKKKQSFRERYKNIANSDWFKRTHENMSVDIYENTDSNECFDPLIDEEIDLWIKENEDIHHNNKDIIELMRDMSYEVSRLTKNLYMEKVDKIENYCSDCVNKKGCINCVNGNLKETLNENEL